MAEEANIREEKEAKSKEAQVNRLISSIQANIPVLISVFHGCIASCEEILILQSRKFLLVECRIRTIIGSGIVNPGI